MNRIPSYHGSYLSKSAYFVIHISQNILKCGLRRRLLCLILILNLLILPGPILAFQQAPAIASSIFNLTIPVRQITAIIKSLAGLVLPQARRDTFTDRQNATSHIRITPLKFVGYQNQPVSFSAVSFNSAGHLLQGVKPAWESSDPDKVRIDESGRATLLRPGLTTIICHIGFAEQTARVLVKPGNRPYQTDQEWGADQDSLSAGGSTSTGGMSEAPLPWLVDKLVPTARAQGGGYSGADFLYDELWSEPRNLVGFPRKGVVELTQFGAVLPEGSNHSFAVPLVNLGGRGLAASLTLYYNSRVWARHAIAVTFDPVASWPAPGFSLGYGRIATYGLSNAIKYMYVAPDGTRHYLGQGGTASQTVTLKSTDGSQITYSGNATTGGLLLYPDGTRAEITVSNNRLLPTKIIDTDGNYITITYGGLQCDPNCQDCTCFIQVPPMGISTITDTLGRVIQFSYSNSSPDFSIIAPGIGGTIQNPVYATVASFKLETRLVSGNFSGLTVENRPQQSIPFLKSFYFNDTGVGHFYTYSDFGMVATASVRRQMSQISNGVESASVSFNYPMSDGAALTDAPAFNQRSETPGGTYFYSSSEDTVAKTKTFSITLPYETSQQPFYESLLLLTRSTNTASPANRLLIQSEIKRGPTSFAKTVYTYINDSGGSPQQQSVIDYDDAGIPSKVDFDYDQYGNVTNRREYGYQISGSWQVRRRTRFTYKTEAAYINEYLRSLVTQVELLDGRENTIDADDIVIARKAFIYDDYAALGGMMTYPYALPPGHMSSYDTIRTVRGHISGTTEWIDIAANISHTRLMQYDRFGNLVKAQLSCCNQKIYGHSQVNYWSQPVETTIGNPAGIHLTVSSEQDFNTSVLTVRTDPNDLSTTYGYDSLMRETAVGLPTGASANVNYNDATLSTTNTVQYMEDFVYKTITNSSVRDGWGRTIQVVSRHGGQINASYNLMGRLASKSNPFPQGGPPGPATTYQYDLLGRVTTVTLPDANMVQTSYSGNSMTVTDQAGRKSKRETDGLGRIIKVTEQDSTGALNQHTTYSYNLLDKLTEVNQGGQARKYRYDDLGQLLYERVPEQVANIDDGTGTMWTCKYTYNDFNALATRQDARGVVTTFSYDILQRLIGISYNTTNAPGVATTPNVTYTYDTANNSHTKGLLKAVDVGTSYRESYTYDTFNRIQQVAHTIASRTYTINYSFNEIGQPRRIEHIRPEYDNVGRLSKVKDENQAAIWLNATYNIAGQLTGNALSAGGGIVESFGYDSQRLQLVTQTATQAGTTLMNLSYGYLAQTGQMGAGTTAGNAGQLMTVGGQIYFQNESAAYTYDLQGRLATSSQTTNGVSAQRRFSYDRWGNRTQVWDAINGGSQIQSVALNQPGGVTNNRFTSVTTNGVQASYGYDASGNVTGDGQHTYQYDAENRIISVDGGTAGQFRYDHQNRRVEKIVGVSTTHYLWDGDHVIAEHNGSTGIRQVAYYYAGSRMFGRQVPNHPIDYYLSDRLSVRLMISGGVTGRQGHLAFGEDIGLSGQPDKHRFTTYERDSETATDYAINRQYSPLTGRFNRPDPIAGSITNPQSLNRFSYVRNDPINSIDPLGLITICFWDISTRKTGYADDPTEVEVVTVSCIRIDTVEVIIDPAGPPEIDWKNWIRRLFGVSVNDCEEQLIQQWNVNDLYQVYKARDSAEKDTDHLPGITDGFGDAVRHCTWSCRMARNISDDKAQAWGNAHECPQQFGGETAANRMDYHNNRIGRDNAKQAKSDKDCLTLCSGDPRLGTSLKDFQ